MKIVVDAMGGDHAPGAIVEGAVLAVKEDGAEIILVGIKDLIEKELQKFPASERFNIDVVHADEVVTMEDSPSKALRGKRKSSMKIGLDLVKKGEAGAFVSAGNTGAVLAYSTFILRPLKGVDRPAIAVQLPTLKGTAILLDAGANVDCKAAQLFQFAIMGHVYAKHIIGSQKPEVGLLSIGEEDSKGNEITKEVFQMLKKSHINFIGNIEGKEVYKGNADVIVCDGFLGNVALKISESLAHMIGVSLKKIFMTNWISKFAALLLKPYLETFKRSVDHSETGGAPLLGINGVCIIAHGSSSPKAIKNAIKRANEFIEKKVNEHIQEDIEENLEDQDLWMRKGIIWQNLKESIHFGADSANDNEKSKEEPSKNLENPSESKESSELNESVESFDPNETKDSKESSESPESPDSISPKPTDLKPEAAE
jgi:phosphate acyltransferase